MRHTSIALLAVVACKNAVPTETDTDTDTEDTDTDTVVETGDADGPSHTLDWDLRPDPGLAAPTAVALRVGDEGWQAVQPVGQYTWLGPDTYEMAVACVTPEDRGDVLYVADAVGTRPEVRLACPQLDPDQAIDLALTVEGLPPDQYAVAMVGAGSYLASQAVPSWTLRTLPGVQDSGIAFTAIGATGRVTQSLAVTRDVQVDGPAYTYTVPSALDATIRVFSPPSLALNGTDATLAVGRVFLWTSRGSALELAESFNAPEVTWGAPPAQYRLPGDRYLVQLRSGSDFGAEIWSMQTSQAGFAFPDAAASATMTAAEVAEGVELQWSGASGGQLAWMLHAVLGPGDAIAPTWRVFAAGEEGVPRTLVLPHASALPGFAPAWDPTDLQEIGGGVFGVAGDAPVDTLRAAGLVLATARMGSGRIAPTALLGTDGVVSAVKLTERLVP